MDKSRTLSLFCGRCYTHTLHRKPQYSETQVVGRDARAIKMTCDDCGEVGRFAVRPELADALLS